MKKIITLFFLILQFQLSSQSINLEYILDNAINLNSVSGSNEDFAGFEKIDSLLQDVEIVMLGEQTHLDGTTFETKIKLIKYLHQNLGFDVLAFESSMYECEKAWKEILEGGDIRTNIGKSVNTFWSPLVEFKELTDYIEKTLDSEQPLEIKGFDNQIGGGMADKTLIPELRAYLQNTAPSLIDEEILDLLNHKLLQKLWYMEFKKFKKKDAKIAMQYLEKVIVGLGESRNKNDQTNYWIRHLKNLHAFVSDLRFGTERRDEEMAKNLIWLKEQNPNKKIICWGATSHFLYNSKQVDLLKANKSLGQHYKKHRMMGDYLKEKYQDKVYTIGFTCYEGEYGTIGYGLKGKIKPPIANSLEQLLGEAEYENFILPLDNELSSDLVSRPLGYQYITTNISRLMDAVIFNRTMKKAKVDLDLFRTIYPDHKYIK